jgi:rhamnosyltransferase
VNTVDNISKGTVDVIILTYKPARMINNLVKKLEEQHYGVNKIIIINTDKDSIDENAVKGDYTNVEIHHIRKEEFNHGLTRNYGASFSNADYVVFMTQDAIPVDKYLIDELIRPFKDEDVYLTYARQQANKNCKYIEKYIRSFNYPNYDIVKTKAYLETMGIKAVFCSDVCAAYSRKRFIELGEFPETNFNEDTIFAYKVLMADKKVYYASNATVIHSHNYTYRQQFKRNFDVGKSQSEFAYVFDNIKSESEGIKMIKSALSHIIRHGKWYMIPDLIISSGFKFLGYKVGKNYKKLPEKYIEKFTMNG